MISSGSRSRRRLRKIESAGEGEVGRLGRGVGRRKTEAVTEVWREAWGGA